MEPFYIRYRNLLVLLAILMAQIIGLATQVRRTREGRGTLDPSDGPGVRLIRLWANALVSPPEKAIHSAKLGIVWTWQDYIDLRNVRQQNQDLQKTIDRLRLEQASLLEDARQGERLQALLHFQEKYIYTTVAAQAIGSSGSQQSRVIYIDKGSADGLARDMAVITPEGIVGKVRDVFPHTAQVLAINDQTSGAGVILESTRVRGILRGNAAGQTQIVDILADRRIQKGEQVLTAGGDQIFPRGLPVGVVDKVIPDPDRDSFIDVILTPAAHLDRLDEVLVITSTQPRFSADQVQDLTTSQELKGAEAEAIAEQKKASEIKAERLPGLIDPNLPPDQQPLLDSSNPVPVAHPPQALHPDRFTPGVQPDTGEGEKLQALPGGKGPPQGATGAASRQAKSASGQYGVAPATTARSKPKAPQSENGQPGSGEPEPKQGPKPEPKQEPRPTASPAQTSPSPTNPPNDHEPPQDESHRNESRRKP